MSGIEQPDFEELDVGLPTENPIANVYFEAAQKLGYKIEVISTHHGVGTISHNSGRLEVFGRWVGINDITASMLCGNKGYASRLLAERGFAVPDSLVVETSWTGGRELEARLLIEAARGRYPLCIKPLSGSHGIKVVPDIRDEEELLRVLFFDEGIGSGTALFEAQCAGRHYRVVVAYGEVIGCVERTPPSVIGNGVDSLSTLIDDYNRSRKIWSLDPAVVEARQQYVIKRRDGLVVSDIVDAGQIVVLDDRCNLKVGGNIHYVDPGSVSEPVREMCVGAAAVFDLEFAGLDLIGGDITSTEDDNWFINEVNSQPAAHVPVPTMNRSQRLDWPARLLTLALHGKRA